MKKITLILTLLIVSYNLFLLKAQTIKTDSLENLLQQHKKQDTTRLNILFEITYELSYINNDNVLKFAKETVELADKLNLLDGKAWGLNYIGIHYDENSDYPQALEYYQKSLKVYEEIGDTLEIVGCWNSIGNILFWQSNYPQAFEYYQKALKMAEGFGDKEGIGYGLNNLGLIYKKQGNHLLALEHYQKSLKIAEEIGDKPGASNCLNSIGAVYYAQSNYPMALECFQKSLKIAEQIRDNTLITYCINNIGLIQEQQGNYSQALEYYQQSLKIDKEIGDKQGIAVGLGNIGDIHQEQGNYLNALEYYQKSLKIAEEIGNKNTISGSLNSIGKTLQKQSNYPQALEYYQKSIEISEEIGNKLNVVFSYMNIGAVYLKTNNYGKALNYTLKSLKIAVELGLIEDQKDIHEQLSEIYDATKNYKKAYESYVLFKELNDSVFNEENIKKITGLEYQYEFDKEKQANKLEQQKKDAIHAEEAKRQKTVRNSFIAGFILMILLVLVVLRSFLQKRKANRILALQKQKIEDTNEELFQQKEEIQAQSEELIATNDRLQELDKFKEEMTGMIVHDLKNPLNSIIGLAENNIVKQSGKQMLNMIMNILDVHKYENAEIQLQTTDNSIYELSESALHQVNLLYEQKNIKLENYIKNDVVAVDKEIVERIFVNILTNAIKYTPNNGTITLESHKNSDDFVRLNITDTGIGIPNDKLNTVFGKFEQVIGKKSGITRSTGIGLTFCKLFVEAQGGEIGVESELEKGTTLWFTLPAGDLQSSQDLGSLTINKEITEEKPFELSKADKEILKPVLSKLQKLIVYESSDIEKIFEQIDFTKTEHLEKWKKEMDNALYVLNQEKYSNLIKMIN